MCDFSLEAYSSRPAQQGEILELQRFVTHTNGFVSAKSPDMVVCLLPGTKVLVAAQHTEMRELLIPGTKATFTQVDRSDVVLGSMYHRDALHFAGTSGPILLQELPEGLMIEVVEIPVEATTKPTDAPAESINEGNLVRVG